jgi:mRNA interferase MazF
MSDLLLAPFDVVVVPFPFTDRNASKRRPALVLSSTAFNQKAEHSVLAMITSAGQSSWPGDYFIEDLDAAGLPAECVIRLKLFTLDHRLVIRKAGTLGAADQKKLRMAWKSMVAI